MRVFADAALAPYYQILQEYRTGRACSNINRKIWLVWTGLDSIVLASVFRFFRSLVRLRPDRRICFMTRGKCQFRITCWPIKITRRFHPLRACRYLQQSYILPARWCYHYLVVRSRLTGLYKNISKVLIRVYTISRLMSLHRVYSIFF